MAAAALIWPPAACAKAFRRHSPEDPQARRDPRGTAPPARVRAWRALLIATPPTVTLAGIAIPGRDETKHFKLIGTTGTGKSTAIREILGAALHVATAPCSPIRMAAIAPGSLIVTEATSC